MDHDIDLPVHDLPKHHVPVVHPSSPLILPEEYNLNIPLLRDCNINDKSDVLIKKLKLCKYVFNFNIEDDRENIYKDMKKNTLIELIEMINHPKLFNENILIDVFKCIEANLFRALPPGLVRLGYDPEEEDSRPDDSWPHLSLVYDLFLKLLVSSEQNSKVLKKFITPAFVTSLIELFDSDDSCERDMLKTILHEIYGKFMSLRAHIRQTMNNLFYRFLYDPNCPDHNGIGVLLEILGSIINGFAVPLKAEHKKFLLHTLMPLHRVKLLMPFSQQLGYCVTQFLEKDGSLSVPVILQLLKYWPLQSSPKEVFFLNELENLLHLTSPENFQQLMVPLFKRIAKCIGSTQFQVAERSLFLWNNDYIATLISDYREVLLTIVFGPLYKNSINHWNITVLTLSQNVLTFFNDNDAALYNKCLDEYKNGADEIVNSRKDRKNKWEVIEKTAKV